MANIEPFFSLQNLFFPTLLCHLSSVPVHIMDSTNTKTSPWLFSPSSSQLIKSYGFISKIDPESIEFSPSPLRPLSPWKSLSGNEHHLPTGSTASTLAPLPTAVRGHFVRCASCGGTLLLKALVAPYHTLNQSYTPLQGPPNPEWLAPACLLCRIFFHCPQPHWLTIASYSLHMLIPPSRIFCFHVYIWMDGCFPQNAQEGFFNSPATVPHIRYPSVVLITLWKYLVHQFICIFITCLIPLDCKLHEGRNLVSFASHSISKINNGAQPTAVPQWIFTNEWMTGIKIIYDSVSEAHIPIFLCC